ncbi:MAG: TY-Chap domain-containing protein [Candidatus Dormibacteria bacterium]
MTPAEIEALHEERRVEFWRSPGPAASLNERQEFWRNVQAARLLDEDQRRQMAEEALGELLDSGKERAYVVFSNLDQPDDEYVQFFLEDGLVYGEVGSRDWGTAPRSLPLEAVERLAELGFVRFPINYGRAGLAPDGPALAELLETLFRLAYGTPPKFALGVTVELQPVGHSPGRKRASPNWSEAVPPAELER